MFDQFHVSSGTARAGGTQGGCRELSFGAMPHQDDAPPRRSHHAHFELVAPLYDRVFGRSDPAALLAHLALEPGTVALDIGGGTGRIAAHLADLGATVTVFDVSRSMLARAHGRGLSAAIALAESLPVATATVDRIVVVDAFHHFAHQEWAARELVRVLMPGGLIVIEEPDIRRIAAKGIAIGEKLARMQSHFMTPAAMARLFESAGARVQAIAPDGWSVHLVVTK